MTTEQLDRVKKYALDNRDITIDEKVRRLAQYDEGFGSHMVEDLIEYYCEVVAEKARHEFLTGLGDVIPKRKYYDLLNKFGAESSSRSYMYRAIVKTFEDGYEKPEVPPGKVETFDGQLELNESQERLSENARVRSARKDMFRQMDFDEY